MTNDKKKQEKLTQRSPDKFEPGALQTEEKDLAEECVRFADIRHYFSQKNMDLPSQIVAEVRLVSKLPVADRIVRVRRLNQDLMGGLNEAHPDPRFRQ